MQTKYIIYIFSFTVHDALELFEVPQFDLQFFQLRLDKQRHGTLNLFLFVERQLTRLDGRGRQSRRGRILEFNLADHVGHGWRFGRRDHGLRGGSGRGWHSRGSGRRGGERERGTATMLLLAAGLFLFFVNGRFRSFFGG